MPKKTAYSRSGAQRSKAKQKSFELVRPVSDENVLDSADSAIEDSEEEEEVIEVTDAGGDEVEEEVEEKVESRSKASKGAAAAAVVSAAPAVPGTPRSAAARLAARRQAGQKTQRASANLITAEHYAYVRKDLIYILVLAIILFGIIIALHFILGS